MRLMFALSLLSFAVPAVAAEDHGHHPPPKAATGKPLASAKFRAEHASIQEHLQHARDWNAAVATSGDKAKAQQIVAFFKKHIAPHAKWEEEKLYPLIDQLAGTTEQNRFTATMRHEHRIVERWLGELEKQLLSPKPDLKAFSRRADNLIGLVEAHFALEEEVLLPKVDAKLTAEKFDEALGGTAAH